MKFLCLVSLLGLLPLFSGCASEEQRYARKLDSAITAADDYFAASQDKRYAEIGLLTQYLKRKYPDVLNFQLKPFPDKKALGNTWIVVSRFADFDYRLSLKDIRRHPNPINQMTTAAIYCDKIALPASYMLTLKQANKLGGLALTHGVMAAYWAMENGCITEQDLPRDILPEQIKGLQQIAQFQSKDFQDLGIEAVAFLYYVGRPDLVQQQWVDRILLQQNADGGWGGWGKDKASDLHASALALWVLLEARYPNRKMNWLPDWHKGQSPQGW